MNRKRSKTRRTIRSKKRIKRRTRTKKGGLSHGFGRVPMWHRNKAADTYRREKRICADHYGYKPHLPRWWQSLSDQEIKDYEDCKNADYDMYINQNMHDYNNDNTYETRVNNARRQGWEAQVAATRLQDLSSEELDYLRYAHGYIYN